MLGIPGTAVGAIAAALIAGTVSLLGLIVSKEQKISEFRQNWIDELRKEIALLISHANAIHGSMSVGWQSKREAWSDVRTDFVGINEAAGKIRMRLNPAESNSQAILKTIEELEAVLNPGKTPPFVELNRIEKRLINEANTVLKCEWRRVKSGERTYKAAKYSALAIVALSAAAIIYYAIDNNANPFAVSLGARIPSNGNTPVAPAR